MHTNSKVTKIRLVVAWGRGWREGWPSKGNKECFWDDEMFCIFIVLMVLQMCTTVESPEH